MYLLIHHRGSFGSEVTYGNAKFYSGVQHSEESVTVFTRTSYGLAEDYDFVNANEGRTGLPIKSKTSV